LLTTAEKGKLIHTLKLNNYIKLSVCILSGVLTLSTKHILIIKKIKTVLGGRLHVDDVLFLFIKQQNTKECMHHKNERKTYKKMRRSELTPTAYHVYECYTGNSYIIPVVMIYP